MLVGIRLNDASFVRGILAPRLSESAANEFTLGVTRKSSGERIFTTDASATGELKQQRQLWLFPDLVAGIQLRGTTIEDIARSRFQRNLVPAPPARCGAHRGRLVRLPEREEEMDFVRMKSDFVSNVSHELRTPLALIRMYAETLDMGRAATEEEAGVLRDDRPGDRAAHPAGEQPPEFLAGWRREENRMRSRTDLNAVVRDVMESFNEHLAHEASPAHRARAGPSAVIADAEALQEALINMIDNAVKYSGEEKFLRVATGRNGAWVFVEVEDHGVGIAPEHQAKIFETFYRVSDGLVHKAKGSGLGLAIAQHIMDAQHGRIEVTSTPGSEAHSDSS